MDREGWVFQQILTCLAPFQPGLRRVQGPWATARGQGSDTRTSQTQEGAGEGEVHPFWGVGGNAEFSRAGLQPFFFLSGLHARGEGGARPGSRVTGGD